MNGAQAMSEKSSVLLHATCAAVGPATDVKPLRAALPPRLDQSWARAELASASARIRVGTIGLSSRARLMVASSTRADRVTTTLDPAAIPSSRVPRAKRQVIDCGRCLPTDDSNGGGSGIGARPLTTLGGGGGNI